MVYAACPMAERRGLYWSSTLRALTMIAQDGTRHPCRLPKCCYFRVWLACAALFQEAEKAAGAVIGYSESERT